MNKIYISILFLLAYLGNVSAQSSKDKVVPLDSINTEAAEYSPQWVDSTLIYCTTGLPLLNITPTPITGYFKATQSKVDSLTFTNGGLYLKDILNVIHLGPFCFNRTRDTIYYTTIDLKPFQKADYLNKMQINIAVKSGKSWKEIAPFPYNSEEFNTGHPVLSYDSKNLYFISDREGGYGATDIWHSRYENGKWSQPENMGPEINSAGKEGFPAIFKNRIYFSSTGKTTEADYDIYYSEFDDYWRERVRLKEPVNSSADDFGISFQKTGLAFFSSNREGGKGMDDIYVWIAPDNKNVFSALNGRLLRKDEVVKNINLSLLNADKILIQNTKTNAEGKFELKDIDGSQIYSMRMDLKEDSWKTGHVLELFNKKGELVKRIAQDEFGNFNFELLNPDDYDNLALIDNQDDSFLNIPLKGMLFYETEGDAEAGINIYLLDNNDNVIQQVESDSAGLFLFENVFPRDVYKFRVNDGKNNLKIVLYNGKGEVIQTLVKSRFGDFVYERLANDDSYISLMNEDDVMMNIKLDDNFTTENIYYELDKWDIMPESEPELNRIAKILIKNPKVGINLEAHTDSRGNNAYNQTLSEKRAAATKAYFVEQGIPAGQIKAVGLGESQPKNKCVDGVPCSPEEHAVNRRTEFNFMKL